MSYAFGDTDLAARRLDLVAAAFEEPSRAFLAERAPPSPAVALDLGCGPGHTSRLMAEVTGAARVVAMDASEAFLERAAAVVPPAVELVRHDVTAMPLPGAPADLVYCRLLLAHLPDPAAVVGQWAGQLRPGGRLLLDELEYMHADHPVLVAYEEAVVDLVGARGAAMYAGPLIAGAVTESRIVAWDVPVRHAARMYAMNLAVWRHDAAVAGRRSDARLDELAAALADLAEGGEGAVHWGLHQAVVVAA